MQNSNQTTYGFNLTAIDEKNPVNTLGFVLYQIAGSERDALLMLRRKFAGVIMQINDRLEPSTPVTSDAKNLLEE